MATEVHDGDPTELEDLLHLQGLRLAEAGDPRRGWHVYTRKMCCAERVVNVGSKAGWGNIIDDD